MATVASDAKMSAEVQGYLRKAKAQDTEAQFNLGYALANGDGVAKDERQAVAWYRKAAEQGHATAQYNLGNRLRDGRGVAKDERQAVEWTRRAAEQGHALAQHNLGVCFTKGLGGVKDEKQAVKWYRKAAEQGDASAQCALGQCFANGDGVAKDEKQAVEWYRKAAEQGHANAQYNLGNRLRDGRGVAKDERQAVEWYRKAAEQGHAGAQYNLGVMLRDGQGVDQDQKQAVEWYRKAAEQGYAWAQNNLGVCFKNGLGVAKDERQAVEWYRKAAEQGDASAQCALGQCFAYGQGVAKDEQQAVEWYRKAAEQGHAYAQCNLGVCFEKGRGVAKDEQQAVVWYRKAAEQGDAEAQFELGCAFRNGQGVAKDERKAVEWYQRAAEQGFAYAQFNLGMCFKNGQGVSKDERQAVVWWRRAAEQGHANAQYNLGNRLRDGRGVAKDERQAVVWYRKAAEQGYADAEIALERLQASLSTTSLTTSISEKPTLLAEERKKQDEKQKAETKTQQEKVAAPALATVPRIAWKEIVLGELVGNGSYGDVYKGQWQGAPVAIKVLQLKTLSGPMTKEFEHESDLMMKCRHPSVVNLYGVCTEPGHLAMVMDYLPTSLRTRLQDGKELSWLKRLLIAEDMAKGLAYLHSRNILHRDLKSFNILLDENERARIADFGLAKVKLEIGSTSTKTHKAVGSLRWRAPELFDFPPPPSNAASDVYSLGVLLWELVTRQLPYSYSSDESMVAAWIGSGKKEKIPDDCPKAFAEIIQACWSAPEKRPTAEAIVKLLEAAIKEATEALRNAELEKKQLAEKIWHFDASLKPGPDAMKEGYVLIKAGAKDTAKVLEAYQRCPVPGFDIGRVEIIFNSELNRSFASRLRLLQGRQGNPAFQPKWSAENESEWRGAIHTMFEKMTAAYQDKDCPNVKLLPVWHGTRKEILPSLFKTGFASLALVDAGYFGKGIYGAYEAEYSYRVYSKGALLLNWVACFSAYPVIDGDMPKLEGRANYANYDAHVAPVVPEDAFDLNPESYVPCKPGQPPQCTEVVVFDWAAMLPRYLVELQPSLPKAPAVFVPEKTPGNSAMLYAYLSSSFQAKAKAKPESKTPAKKVHAKA